MQTCVHSWFISRFEINQHKSCRNTHIHMQQHTPVCHLPCSRTACWLTQVELMCAQLEECRWTLLVHSELSFACVCVCVWLRCRNQVQKQKTNKIPLFCNSSPFGCFGSFRCCCSFLSPLPQLTSLLPSWFLFSSSFIPPFTWHHSYVPPFYWFHFLLLLYLSPLPVWNILTLSVFPSLLPLVSSWRNFFLVSNHLPSSVKKFYFLNL